MRTLFSIIFTLCVIATSAQTTPPSVVRSSSATTQVDPYLTALRRLGIPTVAGDSLETTGTPQNSVKLIYNTTLGKLRVYNPVTGLWSDASGGIIAGVEHINGKDGDLKIVAGSNVTIDNSKSDTIVINSILGDFIPLSGTEVGKPVTGTISFDWDSIETGANARIDYDEGFIINRNVSGTNLNTAQIQGGNLSISTQTDSNALIVSLNITPIDSALVLYTTYQTPSNPPNTSLIGFKGHNVYDIRDSTYFIQKYHLDSAISNVTGNYLPLDIQDSTTVKLNGNSVMFKGDNHSLVMNTPFDALAIGGAVMDGFRSQQYDDILTMNGVMKVPIIIEDTTRYPIMFVSRGMPFSDTAKFAMLRGVADINLGYLIATSDEAAEEVTDYNFSHSKLFIERNYQPVFEIDIETGVLTVTNEIIGDSYHPKTSPFSVPQMQDLARTIVTNPANNTLINPETKEVVVKIESDSVDIVLPDIVDCDFWHLYVKNNSSTPTNITSVSSANIFWNSGTLTDSVDVSAGAIMHIIFDGVNYSIE